ncbi:MAG: hypothetical protein AB8B50_00345 [Pirellulaceae bacterium]
MIGFSLLLEATLRAQGPNSVSDVEVMRVYVPQENIKSALRVFPDRYELVDRSRLTELLRENAGSSSGKIEQGISEAIYLARLEGSVLVSDSSRWLVAEDSTTWIGNLDLPLKRARNLGVKAPQLFDLQRFSTDGSLVLRTESSPEVWFGFSLRADAVEQMDRFQVRIPVATRARMLIQTPNTVALDAESVVVRQVAMPSAYLPEDWPKDSIAALNARDDQHWWLVELGGVSSFELQKSDTAEAISSPYSHQIPRIESLCFVGESGIRQTTQIELADYAVGRKLRLAISKRTQISRVTLNDVPVTWMAIPGMGADRQLVDLIVASELSSGSTAFQEKGIGSDLTVDSDLRKVASSPLALTPSDGQSRNSLLMIETVSKSEADEVGGGVSGWSVQTRELPEIEVVDSYCMVGRTRVVSDSFTDLVSLGATHGTVRPVSLDSGPVIVGPAGNDSGETEENSGESEALDSKAVRPTAASLIWDCFWSGTCPKIEATLSTRNPELNAETLTRLSFGASQGKGSSGQKELRADCGVRVRASYLKTNEIRLRIARDWVLDRASLSDRSGGIVDLKSVQEERNGRVEDLLLVNWSSAGPELEFDLSILVHARARGVEQNLPRVVTVDSADHRDFYAIGADETSRLKATERLLRHRVSFLEMPDWQRELLGGAGSVLIGNGRRLPPIELETEEELVSSKVVMIVRPQTEWARSGNVEASELSMSCIIDLTSDAQGPRRSVVHIPQRFGDPKELTWCLLVDGERIPVDATLIKPEEEATSPSARVGYYSFVTSLPVSETDTRTLLVEGGGYRQGARELVSKMELPRVEGAVTDESVLLLPSLMMDQSNVRSQAQYASLEVLPASACYETSELERIVGPALRNEDWIGLRDASGSASVFEFAANAVKKARGVWIDQVRLRHQMDAGNTFQHNLGLRIRGRQGEQASFQIPVSWKLLDSSINAYAVQVTSEVAPDAQDSTGARRSIVRIAIPKSGEISLTLRFESQRESSWWSSFERLDTPEFLVPVLKEDNFLTLPSAWQVVSLFGRERGGSPVMGSVLPADWWRWVHPHSETMSSIGNADRLVNQGNATNPELAADEDWTTIRLSPEEREGGVWIAKRSGVAAMLFILVGFVAFIAFHTFAKYPRFVAVGFAIGLLFGFWLPSGLSILARLVCLGVLSGVLCRMCWAVSRNRVLDSQRSEQKRLSTAARLTPSEMASLSKSLLWIGLLLGLPAVPCSAQQSTKAFESLRGQRAMQIKPGTRVSDAAERVATSSAPQLFELLIPMDEDESVSGSVVYVPKDLLRRLEGRKGEANGESAASWIQSAEYSIRLANPEAPTGFAAEVTATYQIDVGVSLAPIRFPFGTAGLELVEAEINGEPDDAADRELTQDEDGVVFSPRLSGPVQLMLYFRFAQPDFDMTGGSLRFGIPPIAASNLVVNHDPTFRVSTNARGTQVEFENRTSALLGPTEFLSVQWQRKDSGQFQFDASSAKTHVWAHGAESHVSCRSLIQVANPMALPREFHIIVNDDWAIVGKEAGDAVVQRSSRPPLSNKRRYEVVWKPSISGAEDAVIDLSLARPPEVGGSDQVSLRLPQPYIQELTVNEEQYLSWSSTADGPWDLQFGQGWLPVGAAGIVLPIEWPAVQQQIDSFALVQESGNGFESGKESYLLPLTRNAPLLVQRTNQQMAETNLSIDWHYEQDGASIECIWDFDDPWRLESYTTELTLPSPWTLESVEADGEQLVFQEYRRGNQKTATIYFDDARRAITQFRISAHKEIRLDAPHPLEKPTLSDVDAMLERVSVFCRAGYVCRTQINSSITELIPSPDSLAVMTAISPQDRAGEFEYYVGDLSSHQLDAMLKDQITCRFTLDGAESSQLLSFIEVQRDAVGNWEGRWNVTWQSADAPPSCLLLSCPRDLMTQLTSDVAFQSVATGGDSSQLLLVPIQDGMSGVEFQFPLNREISVVESVRGETQGRLKIPGVQVISGDLGLPLLVLPKRIEEDLTVAWTDSQGAALVTTGDPNASSIVGDERTAARLRAQLNDDVSVHPSGPGAQVIAWNLESAEQQSSTLLSASWVVDRVADRRVTGWVDYWIRPGKEVELELSNPGGLEVLGASNGSRLLDVDSTKSGVVRVALVPTRLPSAVRVFWQRRFSDEDTAGPGGRSRDFDLFKTSFGSGITDQSEKHIATIEIRDTEWRLGNASRARIGMVQRAELWAELVARESERIAKLSKPERVAFAQSWDPDRLELDKGLTLSVPVPEFGFSGDVSVGDTWLEVLSLLQLSSASPSKVGEMQEQRSTFQTDRSVSASEAAAVDISRSVAYSVEGDRCRLESNALVSNSNTKWTASVLVVAVCSIGIWISVRFRQRFLAALVAFPFLYWCLLAVLCWVCLPVSWPGWILLAAACFLGVGNWFDHRRARVYR